MKKRGTQQQNKYPLPGAKSTPCLRVCPDAVHVRLRVVVRDDAGDRVVDWPTCLRGRRVERVPHPSVLLPNAAVGLAAAAVLLHRGPGSCQHKKGLSLCLCVSVLFCACD